MPLAQVSWPRGIEEWLLPGPRLMKGKTWTRSQRIRTAAELPLVVDLADPALPPKYQQIAERAAHLRELGMTYRSIGEVLGVDAKSVRNATGWWETRSQDRHLGRP